MGWTVGSVFVWLVLLTTCATSSDPGCPEGCKCTPVLARDVEDTLTSVGQKVVCHEWKKLPLPSFPADTVHLVITNAGLTHVPTEVLSSLSNLVKIDFSRNKIFEIDEDAFANLTSLEKIDFSDNSLISLIPEMFSGLPLQVRINLEGNPLICDCQLKWLIDWIHTKRIRLSSKSTCQYPIQFRGLPIHRMKRKDMHCNYPLQLPTLEIHPIASQLVFEGDSLAVNCRVTRVDRHTHLRWFLDGHLISPDPIRAVTVAMHNSSDNTLESSVVIGQLHRRHSGLWICNVETTKGNASRSVSVVVISGKAQYCPANSTFNNKGSYSWPSTIAGITVSLPCAGMPTSSKYNRAIAYHVCRPNATWSQLVTGDCPFVSEVTKVLEQFSKTNLTISKTVLETARGLRNYTGDGRMLRDPMDVVFIARTLENYLEFVSKFKEIGDILVDVISTVMHSDRRLLRDAQREDRACSRMLRVLSSLAKILPDTAFSRYHDNLVLEEFLVKLEGFTGLRCTLYQEKRHKSLHCISVNASLPVTTEKELEASIYVPPSIITYLGQATNSHKLQFVLYQDTCLFQRPPGQEGRDVTSLVIATRAAHGVKLLNHLVEVILKVPVYTDDVYPAWWNSAAAGGQGDWVTEGCNIVRIQRSLVTFTCTHLGTFGLLQDLRALEAEIGRRRTQFRIGPPALYVGSFISASALSSTIALYGKAWKRIYLSKKIKHSLVNTWVAMTALIFVYTLGILQVDINWLCQGMGVMVHYLTLCALMWMLITINNMYKKLKKQKAPETPPEEPQEPVPPKPMLRFYFLGWGIGIIVCGISAAVHIEKYSGPHYCFLSPGPSLSAVYGPVSILLLFLIGYSLLVHFALRTRKETSETPLVGLQSGQSLHRSVDLESVIDTEFSNALQLRAHLVVLALFGLTWASGAATIARPFALPFGDLILSLVYCFLSSFLGLFVFGFFCYSRQDIWLHLGKVKIILEQENMVLEDQGQDQAELTTVEHQAAVAVETEPQDDETTWNSASEKLVNASPKSERVGRGINRLARYDAGAVEVFYNPRQSIVARRFFEKNRRRQQLKLVHKNNLAKEAAINSEPPSYNKNSDSDQTNVQGDGGRAPMPTSHSYSGISSDAVFELKDRDLCNQTARFKALQKECTDALGEDLTNRNLLPLMTDSTPRQKSRTSVLEVAKAQQCALGCCSDVTESSVASHGRRRRSRVRNKWQKPAHQHSWDDKYCQSQVFAGTSEDGRRRRKGKEALSCWDKRFARSQSAYEQVGESCEIACGDGEIKDQARQETSL